MIVRLNPTGRATAARNQSASSLGKRHLNKLLTSSPFDRCTLRALSSGNVDVLALRLTF